MPIMKATFWIFLCVMPVFIGCSSDEENEQSGIESPDVSIATIDDEIVNLRPVGTETLIPNPVLQGPVLQLPITASDADGTSFSITQSELDSYEAAWAPVTVPYNSDCTEDCIPILRNPKGAHGGEIVLSINPKVDDEIAQWARCSDSIMSCYTAKIKPYALQSVRNTTMYQCVADSACPQACVNSFERYVDGNYNTVDRMLERVFWGPSALCQPQDGTTE